MRQRTARHEETDARKKFSRFKKENPNPVRKFKKVEKRPILEELARILILEIDNYRISQKLPEHRAYDEPAERLTELNYTAKDIEDFSIMLTDFEERYSAEEVVCALVSFFRAWLKNVQRTMSQSMSATCLFHLISFLGAVGQQ